MTPGGKFTAHVVTTHGAEVDLADPPKAIDATVVD